MLRFSPTGVIHNFNGRPYSYSRAENNPAWLESVLRNRRSAESSARHRQMAAAKVTMLSLEAMGKVRLQGTTQTWCVCARSMEYQQKRAWPMAPVENPGAIAGLASEGLQQFRSAIPCGMTGICSLNRRVRSRTHGGVGGDELRGFSLSRLGSQRFLTFLAYNVCIVGRKG